MFAVNETRQKRDIDFCLENHELKGFQSHEDDRGCILAAGK